MQQWFCKKWANSAEFPCKASSSSSFLVTQRWLFVLLLFCESSRFRMRLLRVYVPIENRKNFYLVVWKRSRRMHVKDVHLLWKIGLNQLIQGGRKKRSTFPPVLLQTGLNHLGPCHSRRAEKHQDPPGRFPAVLFVMVESDCHCIFIRLWCWVYPPGTPWLYKW